MYCLIYFALIFNIFYFFRIKIHSYSKTLLLKGSSPKIQVVSHFEDEGHWHLTQNKKVEVDCDSNLNINVK